MIYRTNTQKRFISGPPNIARGSISECADFLSGGKSSLAGVRGAKAEIKLDMKCVLTEKLNE